MGTHWPCGREGRASNPDPGQLFPRSWRSTCCGPVVFGAKGLETSLIHCASKFTSAQPSPQLCFWLRGKKDLLFLSLSFPFFSQEEEEGCVCYLVLFNCRI